MKHIGILAFTYEGASSLYKTICIRAQDYFGKDNYPEMTMHTLPRIRYLQHEGSRIEWWADNLLRSVDVLKKAGAEFVVCPSNGAHEAYPLIESKSPLPWIHLTRLISSVAGDRGFRKVGVLGTKITMFSDLFLDPMKRLGIECTIPAVKHHDRLHYIIREELNRSLCIADSVSFLTDLVDDLKNQGCDAVVLGCTELPMVLNKSNCSIPVLDSVEILAEAACKKAGSLI